MHRAAMRRLGRFILLAGVGLSALSLLLAATPIQWQIERYIHGVPDQYYPELFWLFVGLPVSLIVSATGGTMIVLTRQARSIS